MSSGGALRTEVQRRDADSVVVVAEGRIDAETFQDLEEILKGQLQSGARHIVLDLSLVSFCDSSGFSALVRVHREAVSGDGWIRVAGAMGQVQRVLDMTNLGRVLGDYATVSDAMDESPPVQP